MSQPERPVRAERHAGRVEVADTIIGAVRDAGDLQAGTDHAGSSAPLAQQPRAGRLARGVLPQGVREVRRERLLCVVTIFGVATVQPQGVAAEALDGQGLQLGRAEPGLQRGPEDEATERPADAAAASGVVDVIARARRVEQPRLLISGQGAADMPWLADELITPAEEGFADMSRRAEPVDKAFEVIEILRRGLTRLSDFT